MPPISTILFTLAAALPFAAAAPPSAPKGGGTWQDLGPIALQPRQEHTAVVLNATTLALVGGIIPVANGSGGNSPSDWVTTDMFQLYNAATETWALGPSLPFAVNHPNTVVVENKLYLLGGLEPDAQGNWVATGKSYVLDLTALDGSSSSSASWRPLASAPADLVAGSAAVGAGRDGRVYLAGGLRQLIPQDTVASVLAYDTAADAWLAPSELPAAAATMPGGGRDHAGSAVVDGTLYVVGGRRNGQENVRDTVFALDLRDPAAGWATRAGRMPTPRGGLAAAAVGRRIYTFGGEGNPANGSMGVFPESEVYDVERDCWERLEPMELPRHGLWAVALADGGVYLPGGGIRQGGAAVRKFDVFWPPRRRY